MLSYALFSDHFSFRLQLSRPAPDLTRPDWPGPLVQPRGAALSMAVQWHSTAQPSAFFRIAAVAVA